jgi:hypothetical protein
MTAYWDDYGIVAFDRTKAVENAEAFARMLTYQGVENAGGVDVVPKGRLADYYVAPIKLGRKLFGKWQGMGGKMQAIAGDVSRNAGYTRVIFDGAPGETMVSYAGGNLVIEDLVLLGTPLVRADDPVRAGIALKVETSLKNQVDSGKLTTRGVSIVAADQGIVCGDETWPIALHADNCTHFDLWFDRVRQIYTVHNTQSVDHVLFGVKIWQHAKRGFVFNRGGHLRAYGVSINYCADFELLYLGVPGSNGGNFEVYGISTDAACRTFRLLNHGKHAPRVRMSGFIAEGTTLADPVVLNREADAGNIWQNIKLDVNHGYQKL